MIRSAPAWPHGDPARVARDILAQPGFRHGLALPAEKSWFERLLDFLGDLWHRLTDGFHVPSGALLGLSKFVDIVLLIVAVGLIAIGVFRLASRWTQRPRPQSVHAGLANAQAATDLRAESERAATQGDYARAIALLFGAALRELDERDLVAFDPARTPGEYRRLLRRTAASTSPPFDVLSGTFVRASFAPGLPSQDEYESARRALAAFEFAIGGA